MNLLTIIVYFIGHIAVLCYDMQSIKLLIDILKIQSKITFVNIIVYDQKSIALPMARELSNNNFKFNILSNIANFSEYPSELHRQVFAFDMKYGVADQIIKNAEKYGLLAPPFEWIIFGENIEFQKLDIYARVDSKIYLCENANNDGNYTINAIYKINRSSFDYHYNNIGTWNDRNGFVNYNGLNIYRMRKNLHGTIFTMSYIFHNPITHKTIFDYRATHRESSARFTFLIIHILFSIFNVSTNYINQTIYGYTTSNVTENSGLIGDVSSGRAVIGGTPIYLLLHRIPIVQFIAPNTKTSGRFYFKQPPLSYVSNIFIKPFDEPVWCCCFILSAVSFVTLLVIAKWEWGRIHFYGKKNTSSNITEPDIGNIAILQLSVVSQQGSVTELKSISGRITLIFTLAAFMFLYTAYSANIVALLQSTSNSITDLEHLITSRIELGVEDIPYLETLFKLRPTRTKKQLFEKKLKPKGKHFRMSLEEGVKRMKNEFFAFYTDGSSLSKIMSDDFDDAEKCNIGAVPYSKNREPWIITSKNGSYAELLKIGLFRLMETGFYTAERKRIFYDIPICTSKISTFLSAGLVDTYPGFIFYGMCLIVCFAVFIIEILVYKYSMV